MPVDENGFLGDEIQNWIQKNRNENKEWFALCSTLNRVCHSTLLKFKIDNNNGQEVICATLFIRALGFYQAAIILIEMGLINEAKIILRSLFDTVFAISAVAKSEEVMREYINDDIYRRIYLLKKIKNNQKTFEPILSKDVDKQIESLLSELYETKKKMKPKEITSRYLAEKAGLLNLYDTAYVYFSSTVHSGIRDLEQYLSLDSERNIKELIWGPSVTGLDRLLLTAFETMLTVFKTAIGLFSLSINELVLIEEGYRKLAKNVSEDTKIV